MLPQWMRSSRPSAFPLLAGQQVGAEISSDVTHCPAYAQLVSSSCIIILPGNPFHCGFTNCTSGTMEGGRQADIAKGILAAKNVPYITAAPLLIQVWAFKVTLEHLLLENITIFPQSCKCDRQIDGRMISCELQDMASWMRDGIAGLQSVVLYSLPELDGAIDTVVHCWACSNNSLHCCSSSEFAAGQRGAVDCSCQSMASAVTDNRLLVQPLGGLVGDNIFLVEERVQRLADRLKKWVALRRTPAQVCRVLACCTSRLLLRL